MACRGVSQELGVLEALEASGTTLVSAGQEIERLILEGYEVMTF